jgi:CHAD domain-containing protein
MLRELMLDRSADSVQTLDEYLYPAIQKQYIAILTHETDVIDDGDVEAVHQMRVSLRRLRSWLQILTPILDVPKVMGNKSIGKIAKILGKVRDLDVLQDICKTYQVDLPPTEQVDLDEVISSIGKRRRKALIKVHSMLEGKEYQYFKIAINNWLNHPRYTSTISVPIGEILPALTLSVVGQLLLNPGWWIDTNLDPTTATEADLSAAILTHGTDLHSLRKQIKATRYLMELFVDRYPPQYIDYLQDLKQIHKLLGNIQDGVVLDRFVQGVLGKRAASKLPTLYAQIDRDRQLNWQAWQPIQHRYQQSTIGQELQLLLIQGIIKDSRSPEPSDRM